MATSVPLLDPSSTERENRKLKRLVTVSSYAKTALSVITAIVALIVVNLTTSLTPDRKVFFTTILGVCIVGVFVVVFVSRSEPIALVIFSSAALYITPLTLGISLVYI
jgi:hypothetical protein